MDNDTDLKLHSLLVEGLNFINYCTKRTYGVVHTLLCLIISIISIDFNRKLHQDGTGMYPRSYVMFNP